MSDRLHFGQEGASTCTLETFVASIERASASAFATDALACCNSSFTGMAESGSTMLPMPEPL